MSLDHFCFPRISHRNSNLLKEMVHGEAKSADKQTEELILHEPAIRKSLKRQYNYVLDY